MNNLPPELLLCILEYVPIRIRIDLRRVSKDWKELIDYLKVKSLTIVENEYFKDQNSNNSSLFKLFLEKMKELNFKSSIDLIRVKNEELFILNKRLPSKYIQIKKLRTFLLATDLIQLNNFHNQFKELIELECYHQYGVTKVELNLDKLKKFKCKLDFQKFKLNTPELNTLEINQLNLFDFDNLDKLKNLNVYKSIKSLGINNNQNELSKLLKSVNLNELIVKSILVNNLLLEKLKNLKLLNVFGISSSTLIFKQIDNLTNPIRDDLQIIFNGFKIDQLKEIRNELINFNSAENELNSGNQMNLNELEEILDQDLRDLANSFLSLDLINKSLGRADKFIYYNN